MPTPDPSDPQPPQPSSALVKELNDSIASGQELDAALRQLCALAAEYEPEAFGLQLAKEGLDTSLAGPLVVLLNYPNFLQDFLQDRISWLEASTKAMISELQRVMETYPEEDKEGLCRQLCRTYAKLGMNPQSFQKHLLSAGLWDSRASEIKSVLDCPEVYERFVAQRSTLAWKTALKLSRHGEESELQEPARRLIRLVLRLSPQIHSRKGARVSITRDDTGRFVVIYRALGKLTIEPINCKPETDEVPGQTT